MARLPTDRPTFEPRPIRDGTGTAEPFVFQVICFQVRDKAAPFHLSKFSAVAQTGSQGTPKPKVANVFQRAALSNKAAKGTAVKSTKLADAIRYKAAVAKIARLRCAFEPQSGRPSLLVLALLVHCPSHGAVQCTNCRGPSLDE
jgi:hypothetical protein